MEDKPVLDSGSTTPESNTFDNLDDQVSANIENMFDDFIEQPAVEETPEPVEEVTDEDLEVSEEGEETSDDNEEVAKEEGDEAEVETAQEESGDLAIVEYEEAKNFKFPVKNSKTGEVEYKTIDQINAEVNRARNQDEARNEVETARAEIETQKEQLKQDQFTMQQMQVKALADSKINEAGQQFKALQEKYNQQAAAGDTQAALQTQGQMNQLQQYAREVGAKVQEANKNIEAAKVKAMETAVSDLSKYGLGELATDKQRVEALGEYVNKLVTPAMVDVLNTNGALLAMAEKSRLYDKMVAEKPKGKLVGSKPKSIKGSAAKSAPKAPKKSAMESKIDSMFDNIG